MRCPHCSQPLITLEFSNLEVDYCVGCSGIWLDNGELEQLIATHGDDGYLSTAVAAQIREKARRCPLCRRRMEKICFGRADQVLLDRCREHGIWSDAGELRKILASVDTEGQGSPLVRLLDEMLAGTKGG